MPYQRAGGSVARTPHVLFGSPAVRGSSCSRSPWGCSPAVGGIGDGRKYHVPDVRLLSVYVVETVPGRSTTCVRLEAEVPSRHAYPPDQ